MITLNATHQQTKMIVDLVASTYQTVLTIDPSVGQSDIVHGDFQLHGGECKGKINDGSCGRCELNHMLV